MKIGDKTLLDMNIEVMSKFCDDIYVVVSIQNQIKNLNNKDNNIHHLVHLNE